MKLDMGAAWSQATAMVAANKDLLLIVAGLFIFLPSLAVVLLIPESAQMGAADIDPDNPMAALTTQYTENAGLFLVLGVVQAIGTLSLFALFAERRPTVGEALKAGLKALLPYIAAYLLFAIICGLVLGVPIALAAAGGAGAIAGILAFIAVIAFIYLLVKVSLTAPVIVIDGVLNPIKALMHSWRLTKGNSLRLFAFYLLLLVVFIVIALIIGLIAGLLAALFGGGIASLLVTGIINGALGAVWSVLFIAVLSAVHRQLSGPSAEAVSETFE